MAEGPGALIRVQRAAATGSARSLGLRSGLASRGFAAARRVVVNVKTGALESYAYSMNLLSDLATAAFTFGDGWRSHTLKHFELVLAFRANVAVRWQFNPSLHNASVS